MITVSRAGRFLRIIALKWMGLTWVQGVSTPYVKIWFHCSWQKFLGAMGCP